MNFLSKIKPLRSTLLVSTLVTLLIMHDGIIMLVFVAIPLILWLAYRRPVITTAPKNRALQAKKITIWLTAIVIISSSQYYYYVSAHQYAQEIVNTLNAYADKNGRYPPNLDAIGVSKEKTRASLGLSGYYVEAGKPHFFYSSTYVPFNQEDYDFAIREWRHSYD